MPVAVGIMAYNEGANIARAVRSVLEQTGPHLRDLAVRVVASGCTDDTVAQAGAAGAADARFEVLVQPRREGKAAAIAFLLRACAGARVVVLAGGDTRLPPGSLDALVAPFDDTTVGMAGGRPVPVNDRESLLGRVVHLLWELHHRVALHDPKLGELVAFRPVFGEMPPDTSVDEALIETLVRRRGLRLVYVPEAVVSMKGPTTIGDFLAQRRRIHAGHLRLRRERGYAVSTMGLRGILRAIAAARADGLAPFTVVAAAVALEAVARGLGAWDARFARRDDRAWKSIASTKDLAP